jgi:hypothetical protein
MPTRRELLPAVAPDSLERSPHLPTAHRQASRAIPPCPRGPDGPRRSPCPPGGGHPRVQHAWGPRPGPQGPQPTTPPWLSPHLAKQRPGPHGLLPCTVPEPRRPCLRAPQRLAAPAMLTASSRARNRLAPAARGLGTDLPGWRGGLHPWGRQLPSHPHLPSLVPGGGLAADRPTWLPSRAHFWVPVNALFPLSRAIGKAAMRPAGLLEQSAPQVWTLPWTVPRPAPHHGPAAGPSLAPAGFRGALSHSRLVGLQDRPVTFPSRTVGRARPRPAHLDVLAVLRRVLQHVLPDGLVPVRHGGLRPARGALPAATLRLLRVPGHPREAKPTQRTPPPPLALRCPTAGTSMRGGRRLGTSPNGFVETGCAAGRGPDDRGAIRCVPPTAPGRRPPALWPPKVAQDGSATASPRPAYAARRSAEAPWALPHPGVRRTRPPLS